MSIFANIRKFFQEKEILAKNETEYIPNLMIE